MDVATTARKEFGILGLALRNKQIAVAVLGQALLDEGGIGAQSITIFCTNKGEAEQLWKIADSLGYANSFRKKKHRNHFHYVFSIKASKRKELYDQISPLPNPTKDKVFCHLANRRKSGSMRNRGETRACILKSLGGEPKTVLQLMLELDINASTVRKHLKNLKRHGLVRVLGKDAHAFQKSLRTANLWVAI
jgi:DNA-binding transcriptional ArsR family regulator